MKRLFALLLSLSLLMTSGSIAVASAESDAVAADLAQLEVEVVNDLEAELESGADDSLVDVTIEEVTQVIAEGDDDEIASLIDTVMDELEAELMDLEMLTEEDMERALHTGRFDEYVKMKSLLDRNKRSLKRAARSRLAELRKMERKVEGRFRTLRRYFRKAKSRVKREVRRLHSHVPAGSTPPQKCFRRGT